MSQYSPPPVLVKTWLMLIDLRSSAEARAHAKRMIDVNFGSVGLANLYLEQSHIDLLHYPQSDVRKINRVVATMAQEKKGFINHIQSRVTNTQS